MNKCQRCGKIFLIEGCRHGVGGSVLCDDCVESIIGQYIQEFNLQEEEVTKGDEFEKFIDSQLTHPNFTIIREDEFGQRI